MAERLQRQGVGSFGASLYQLAFIQNCHRWFAAGYQRLEAQSLSTAQEPAITGELVRAMKEARLEPDAPAWMIRMYVADDPPVNAPGRLGKQRRRVDIEFERSERGIAFHFCCEAKRLYRSDSITEYLGRDGLGMFLAGEYGRDEDFGGMLGYVQNGNLSHWLSRLATALRNGEAQYAVTTDGTLAIFNLLAELPQIHASRHERSEVGRPILMLHTLLLFS